jgi:isopenicillin N synthase-like dioxygenase
MLAKTTTDARKHSTILDQILSNGFATVRLGSFEAQNLADLYREATAFFASGTSAKLRYSVPNRISGYRPHGYAHSGSAYEPDLNDSFLYWKHRRKTLPYHEEIGSFLDAFETYRLVAAKIVTDVVENLQAHYGYKHELPFEEASVLQINSFGVPTDHELLQHPHEDAVLLTVISTSEMGLEAVFEDKVMPLTFTADEVLVMPGSVLTLMTGGEIRPFYHQARNYGFPNRKSVMYFVSPDATNAIEPFVANDFNGAKSIRDAVIKNPQTFGLSEDFLTS